jgi:predicted lipoprotein with Yx(FWY)xxD motif
VSKFRSTAIPVLLGLALLSGCGSSSSNSSSSSSTKTSSQQNASSGSGVVVKTASIPSAGGSVLVNASGLTLYRLSGEVNGKFICTSSACEGVWHPLSSSGATPTGVESLATVKRPDGQQQVTYKGMPLYTFAQDTKPGDAKGQGIKDVGTWNAVKVSPASGAAPATTSTSNTPSSGGGGGYAY